MLYVDVVTGDKPETVKIEILPGSTRRVILSRNFTRFEDQDGAGWRGEQAVFDLGADRTETAADISAAFDGWWEYAASYTPPVSPTVEQRLENMEAALLAMMGL